MKITKKTVQTAALRAILYNLVLQALLWGILLAFSKTRLVAVLSYEFLLQLVILLMLAVYAITFLVFVIGIIMDGFTKRKDDDNEKTA